jgi:aspartyl protease family protein
VLRKLTYALVFIAIGVAMAHTADNVMASTVARIAREQASARLNSPSELRTTVVGNDLRGHFQTEGQIDGKSVNFMVDTGSTVVALNETTAAAIGLRPTPADYNASVGTANGSVRAARARLGVVDVGGVTVRDVDAIVLPDEALKENLLGLSYLSRLKRLEFANGKLVLEQ